MMRLCSAAVVLITLQATVSMANATNFVIILVDDLGYGDLGCYGNRRVRTPEIDRLAASGLRFTDFHANGPMCTPTRAALLTGRYQQRFGAAFEGPLSGATQYDLGLSLSARTIAEALRDKGYVCGMFGKWHLGYRLPFLPTRQGFTSFRGLVSGDGDHHTHVDRSGRNDWWRDERIEMEAGYSVDLMTQHSTEFIRQHREQPFFLYVAHLAIHFPWQGPNEAGYRREGTDYHGLSKLGDLGSKDVGGTVGQMIEAVDQSVGCVIKTLRECGIERDTFVFLTSDNGGYLTYSGGYHNISSNGPLRGQKGELFEGGHRVPAIAVWPGEISAGQVTDVTAATFDLFPTMLAMAGPGRTSDSGETFALDGCDLSPVLRGVGRLPERDLFWRMEGQRAVRRGPWKLLVFADGTHSLFHLGRDLSEQFDCAAEHPEIVRSLLAALAAWETDVDPARAG